MGNIIASQLNLDGGQAFTGAIVLCALLSTCATYAFIKNGFKKGFHHDDIIMNICTIVFTIMLIIGAYTSINHSQIQQNDAQNKLSVNTEDPRYKTYRDRAHWQMTRDQNPHSPFKLCKESFFD